MEVTVSYLFFFKDVLSFPMMKLSMFQQVFILQGLLREIIGLHRKISFPKKKKKQASLTKNRYHLSRSRSSKLQSYKGIHIIRAQTWKEVSRLKVGTFYYIFFFYYIFYFICQQGQCLFQVSLNVINLPLSR